MIYYVIQVKTGGEEIYLRSARKALEDQETGPRLLWLRRRLDLRKRGRTRDALAPVFPGYIFLETESLSNDMYWALRRAIGFYKFLPNNHDVKSLAGHDRELLVAIGCVLSIVLRGSGVLAQELEVVHHL